MALCTPGETEVALPSLKLSQIDLLAQELMHPDCTVRTLTISLTKVDCGDDAARAIARAIGPNTSVQKLCIYFGSIGDAGAAALAAALHTGNCTLRTLSLFSNHVGDAGAAALAAMCASNKSIWSLNLEHNRVGDAGAIALASVIDQGCGLERLNLSSNAPLTMVGASALRRAHSQSHAMRVLLVDADSGAQRPTSATRQRRKRPRKSTAARSIASELEAVALNKGMVQTPWLCMKGDSRARASSTFASALERRADALHEASLQAIKDSEEAAELAQLRQLFGLGRPSDRARFLADPNAIMRSTGQKEELHGRAATV
jgi:hypothetical protein